MTQEPLDDLAPLIKEETFYLERVQQEVRKRIVGRDQLLDSLRRSTLIRLLRSQGVDWVEFDTASDYELPLRRFPAERSARRGYRRQ